MSDDFRDYFNSRLNQEIEKNAQQGISTKYQEVQQAADLKIKALDTLHKRSTKVRQLQENSVIGKLGMDPSSLAGTVVNTAVATADELLPLEPGLVAPRDDTWEEQSGLLRRLGDLGVAGAKSVVGLGDAVIGVGDIATGGLVGKGWDALGRDSKRTHQALDDLYSPEQKLANQNVDAAQGFLGTLEAALDNPSTIPIGIMESLAPMLAGGKIGQEVLALYPKVAALVGKTATLSTGVAGAIGEGTLMAGSQAEGIRQETTDGRLSLKQALLAAGTGVMGAGVARLGNRAANKLGVGDIDEALVAGSLAKSPRGYVTSVGASAVIESAEEAAQSAGETLLKNIATDKEWGEGVGKAAALGIVTAAPLGAYSGLGARAKVAADEQDREQTRKEVQEAAVATGDVSVLIDPKNAAYAPSKAIAALSANSAREDVAPEAKQANLAKAGEIVAKLQAARDSAKTDLDMVSPEGQQQIKDELAVAKAQLAAETDPVKAKQWQEDVELFSGLVANAPKATAEQIKAARAQFAAADKLLTEATGGLTKFNEDLAAGSGDIATAVAILNTKIDEKDAAAVSTRRVAAASVINLSMAIPGNLPTAVAQSLLKNTANGLTPVQRTYLREFTAAREAENAIKDTEGVAQEILFGGNGNLGITQHRQQIASALGAGNQQMADRALALLSSFEEDHRTKAKLAADALTLHQTTGKNTQVIRVGKTWQLNTGRLLPWGKNSEASKNGAITVHMNGVEKVTPLIASMQQEANAITAALSEMQAAYAVKFTPTATQGATNVPVVPQAPAPAANPVPVQQEAKAVGGDQPVSGNGVPAAAVAGVASAGVEARGVDPVPAAAPVSQPTEKATEQISIPDAVKKMTDEELNSALEVEMNKSSYQKNRRFKVLDAEMTRREDLVTSQAAPLAGVAEATEQAVDVATVSNQSTNEGLESTTAKGSTESAETTSNGTLEAIAQKSPEGTAYNLRNVIAEYFTQTASREGDATQRPLAAMKDFLSTGWDKIMTFVQVDEPSKEQLDVLNAFWSTAEGWAKTIQKNLARRNQEFWAVDDLLQFFITETPDGKLELEENVKTAISYAAFSWTAENAGRLAFNTDEEINLILGRDEDHAVEEHERRALLSVGTRQNVVANSLGQRAVQALGLKASKDAPANLMPMLESAMGAHVFKLLMDQGILQRNTVSAADMAALTGSTATDKAAAHLFLKLARDTEGVLNPKAEGIFQANKGTQNFLDKLFGVESLLKEPTLEPVPFTQAKTRNTNQAVPKKLAEIMEHENAGASYVRQDMYHLLSGLDETIALQMAGGISAGSDEAHIANRLSNEAKNNGLLREIQNIKAFVGGLLADMAVPIYFEHSVWKQQRVGISTNMVNPQTSKVHRHMLFRKSWETEVAFDDVAQLENFHLRVAEGLGVKADKQSNTKSLIQLFDKKLSDPKIQAAIQVLQKNIAGETLSEADQEALLAGVQAGGENFKSLDSLMAMAHMVNARMAGKASFTSQLMGEVDGVTNGPMLSHLLMGAADTVAGLFGLLNRGGFFEVGNEHSQYNLWRGAEGHFDLYETTAGHMVQAVQSMVNQGIVNRWGKTVMKAGTVGVVMDAIYGFTGTLAEKDGTVLKAGRNIIKTPLTAMVFGSSVPAAVESMANKFIESIYAGIEDTAKGVSGAQTTTKLIENINLLLSQGRAPGISTSMTIEDLMEHEFKGAQLDGLKRIFKETVGEAVSSTMKQDFAVYIAQRQQFNLAAQTAFELFDAVYRALREQLVTELVASGGIAVNEKTGQPLHDLNAAQEGELRKRLSKLSPVMHTLMSKDSGSLKAGLYMAKSGKKLSTSPTFEGNVKFGTPFSDNGAKSTSTRGFETLESAPGVSMAPMSVHSLDSAISHYAAMLGEVLNVHDAHGAGLATFEQTAKNLNQATWNAMMGYSPASEMQAALSRTVMGLAGLIQEGKLPESAMTNLAEALSKLAAKQEMDPEMFVRGMMEGMKTSAFKADDTKLQALAQMQAIDQYALEGGNYVVTDKDRADASALRAGLSDALSKEELAAIEVIEKALQPTPSEMVETPLEEDPPAAKPNPHGTLGTPARVSAPLVKFFESNPEVSAADAMKQLYGMMGSATGYKRLLIGMLRKAMPADIKVIIVNKDTVIPESKQPEKESRGRAYGWKTGNEIYILGTDFENSGLQTTEILLHELVHGALQHVIADPRGVEVGLIADLTNLMNQAAAYAKQNGITRFEAALSDLDEFVAYGMTHKPLQEMLGQMSVVSTTQNSTPESGFKTFVNKLVGLLFARIDKSKSQEEQAKTALAALIENVTGLLASGTEEQAADRASKAMPAKAATMANNPVGVLNTYSTLDIHNALNAGAVTPEFDAKLKNILGGIVEKLHGPFGTFKAALMQNQALTAVDVWHKALATGVAPFASSVIASPIQASEQERYAMEQVEATVRAALERDVSTTTSAHRELNKLFTEAQALIKPSDFATQDEYDFIFKVELGTNGRSEHLARFAAFGLAHQEVNRLLQKDTVVRRSATKQTIAEKLLAMWEGILELFHEKITSTYSGQRADLKLTRLVDQLVDIEAKRRTMIAKRGSAVSFLAPVEKGAKKLVEAGIEKAVEIAGSNFVKKNSSPIIRAAGSMARVVANNQVDAFMEGFAELRARQWKDRLGWVAGTLNYAVSGSKVHEALLRERKVLEGNRKDIITNRSKMALEFFANKGKDLSKRASESITQVFLRTGMHTLYGPGKFNLAQLENLIGNKPAMDAEIAALEAQLTGFGVFKDDFIDQAASLGYFLATGRSKHEVLMLNAHNIARMGGTKYVGRLTEAQSLQAEAVIEKLISLYAMEYTDSHTLKQAKEVLRIENARTDGGGNGVSFVLDLHKRLEQEAKERLFKGQEALMRHGYTPEIYSPHIDLLTANAVNGAALERRGYVKGAQVANDPAHPDQTVKHLYVLQGGGLMPHLTGSISYDGKQAQGSKQHSGYMNPRTVDGLANATLHNDIMTAKQRKLATGPRRDMTKARGNFMVPVLNPAGDIVNWRYMMHSSTKDSVLQRENRFHLVLGTLAGSIYSKETVTEVNTKVFTAMKEQYDAEKGTKSNAYVMVGPKSPEKELREIWAMLPDESKAEAMKIWGRDGMYVRNDQRDIIFGYRKLSLSDAIKNTQKRRQEAADRAARGMAAPASLGMLQDAEDAMAKFFTLAVEHALVLHARTQGYKNPEEYAERAAVKIARGEAMWQELVGETKDLIVIKTVTVMMGNLKSNLSLLILSGIPIKDIVRDHIVAWKGATAYQRDITEMDRLQTLLDTGQTNGRDVEIKNQITRLKDGIARNPVKELIEAGLMPTIVEDAAADEDAYSYKSQLTQKVDALTGKLHPGVKTLAKNIYMAKDTKAYQTLRQITQLSDFMARYTQYQYLTTRKEAPLSKADAIQQSSDDFINYDIPMHRGMQYLDDAGIMPFMKYFLRIQKVIARTAKDNPARVMGAVLLGNFLDFGPIVLDSSWIHRAGNNPFHWGALQYPGALDELATVDTALSLVGAGGTDWTPP